MRFLLEPRASADLGGLLAHGEAAIDAGLDGVYLAASPALPAPLVAAAAVGGALDKALIAAEVTLGDRNPIELAEEAAVVDLGIGGRLVLVVRPVDDEASGFAEALDLLRTAFAARPFRQRGERWSVPANLPENANNPEHRLRVAPAPLQPRLELWGAGPHSAAAQERGLGRLSDANEDLGSVAAGWAAVEDLPAAIGAPRVRRHAFRESSSLIAELREGRERFGQDWAVVQGDEATAAAIGREVRSLIQVDALPPGLADFWGEGSPPRRPSEQD